MRTRTTRGTADQALDAPLLSTASVPGTAEADPQPIGSVASMLGEAPSPTRATTASALRQQKQTSKGDIRLKDGEINPFMSTGARNCSELS